MCLLLINAHHGPNRLILWLVHYYNYMRYVMALITAIYDDRLLLFTIYAHSFKVLKITMHDYYLSWPLKQPFIMIVCYSFNDDIKTAFLYSLLKEDIYMQLLKVAGKMHVYKT